MAAIIADMIVVLDDSYFDIFLKVCMALQISSIM